ncbi:TIGR04438 family Trp-rich protein [Ideonella sp. B7]|uniref:TIGR04438 family Trp-rich protein n=1 Tax=Ideonella benzenivorans TaxID=2831643 RepID=UPI001CEC6383|nr:TIGR04438 family Trp-rich protein [Ideonella benzenivorans]MCA6217630.1 TIGR04438 family Trp-rich protein [Ideonella benzenivorans]
MVFVALGVLLLVMKLAGWGPVADWAWWAVLLPFGLALAWWGWSDASGLTRRRAMEKDAERKEERRRRNVEALGLGAKDPRRK